MGAKSSLLEQGAGNCCPSTSVGTNGDVSLHSESFNEIVILDMKFKSRIQNPNLSELPPNCRGAFRGVQWSSVVESIILLDSQRFKLPILTPSFKTSSIYILRVEAVGVEKESADREA